MKHAFARVLAIALAICLVAQIPDRVLAADHRDAPAVDALGEGDITDVYAFVDPNDATRVVLAVNVNSFAVPAVNGTYSFSPDMLYQIKIDNTGDGREDFVIQMVASGLGQAQTLKVFGP